MIAKRAPARVPIYVTTQRAYSPTTQSMFPLFSTFIVHISFICDTYIGRPLGAYSPRNLREGACNLYPWTPGPSAFLSDGIGIVGIRVGMPNLILPDTRITGRRGKGRGTNTTSGAVLNTSSESVSEPWRRILWTSMDFHHSHWLF